MKTSLHSRRHSSVIYEIVLNCTSCCTDLICKSSDFLTCTRLLGLVLLRLGERSYDSNGDFFVVGKRFKIKSTKIQSLLQQLPSQSFDCPDPMCLIFHKLSATKNNAGHQRKGNATEFQTNLIDDQPLS